MKKRKIILLSLFLFSFKSKERLCFHDTADLQRKNGIFGKWMWIENDPGTNEFYNDNNMTQETFRKNYYFIRKPGRLARGACYFYPLQRNLVTSKLGTRRIRGEEEVHRGTDLQAEKGTHVHAITSGIIKRISWNRNFGHYVLIQKGALKTIYAHLQRPLGNEGDRIQPGTLIGFTGESGRTTGPHLHLEVILGSARVSPNPFLDEAFFVDHNNLLQ